MHVRIALQAARRASTSIRAATTASLPRARCTNTISRLSRRSISTTLPRQSTPMAAQTDTAAAETAASSGVTPETLSEKLKQTIGATYVSIEDMSGGCGQAFNAIIVSPEFEKKTLLARHRLVNNALKSEIAAIHAWTPKCLTPEQWEKEKEKFGG
ncbi:bola domain protein [Exophiala viscosa]|uniref:Bola domain protein n=1 Tax=Exophiala viscosa TaxID=2486360 RepID=A0AAN6DNY5_9EURO|nr:bola domain protein [Exophiala viscosa]KAI1619760.1 bola domain protein [Exophiala viscosa]